jgi:magnesium transporter
MNRRFIRRAATGPNLPPGTPVFIGETRAETITIEVIDYDAESLTAEAVATPEDIFAFKATPTVTWINVTGLHDVQAIQKICDHFGVHTLVQEDIVNTGQRSKTEDYVDYIYVVMHMMQYEQNETHIASEQVSLILKKNCVITFQERPGDVFDTIRERVRQNKGRIRKMGADYLLYSLLDAVVDNDFLVLEKVADRIDDLETEVMDNPGQNTMHDIHQLKTQLLFLRRSIWPLREAISALEKNDAGLVTKPTRVFLRDLYDHTIQLIDTIETSRDIVSGIFDIYLSSVSNRMNEVMKVLTIIATIFIPLILMASIAIGMLAYFRAKRWL